MLKKLLKVNNVDLPITNNTLQKVEVTNNQIMRDVKTKNLVNKLETKTLSFDFDKRILTLFI